MTGPPTAEVRILGIGLTTALGVGLDENCAGLRRWTGQTDHRTLYDFGELVETPYLAPPQQKELLQENYFYPIDLAVEEALSQCALTSQQKAIMPLFVGSSSYAIGQSENLYQQALAEKMDEALPLPLAGFSQLTAHLRKRYGLAGPDYQLNTACTASANAVLAAARQIRLGLCEYALVIGVELFNLTTVSGFHGMQLLTNDVMRPFDRRRNGMVLGEGCGALLLGPGSGSTEKLIVSGGASGCDTYSVTASNPDGSHISAIMNAALEQAGISPADIIAVKAHGTASPLNDDGEAAGMRRVFGAPPPFFALKPYVGHTLGACGAIEIGILAASIQCSAIPASGGFELMDERLGIAPMTESMVARPGPYMLNFFGFGGNNCSIILTCQPS